MSGGGIQICSHLPRPYQDLGIVDGGVEGWVFTTALSVKGYREAARAESTSVVEASTLNERNVGSACNNGL